MSDASEIMGALGNTIDENTSDEGIDIVNVIGIWVEAMSQDPNMTIERWEDFRVGIENMRGIVNNMIDEQIAKLRADNE